MFSIEGSVPSSQRPSAAWSPCAFRDRLLKVSDRRKPRPASQIDEQTERLAARLLARDAAYAAKVARVRRCQVRLRGQSSRRSWQLYLQLEEAEIERWAHALERVVRWAL